MLAALVAIAFLQQTSALSKDAFDLKELYRLEAVWNDAHLKGDADALDQLWANDLVVTVASMPVMNKADALAMVRSNRMPFSKYDTSELSVKRFPDSAVVTGRLNRERSMSGKVVTDNWRFTKVYVRTEGHWRVIAWHASPAAQ
jgi:ketosteroid isomerase-like protein